MTRLCLVTIDLAQIIKAYDVRGTVPDQLNAEVAGAIGRAFAQTLRELGEDKGSIVVAHDMRDTGPALVAAFTDGVRAEGMDVEHAGLGSTDLLYYASGETLRAWSSWVHIAIGAAAPLGLVWHLAYRRRAKTAKVDKADYLTTG